MALIKCPECGKEVSSVAKNCPFCGFPVAQSQSNEVRISIDRHPDGTPRSYTIKEKGGRILKGWVRSGTVVTIKTDKPIYIEFWGGTLIEKMQCTAFVQPGKKYRVTWGVGFFEAVLDKCFEVDVIDA